MDAKHDKIPSLDNADTLKAGDMSSGKLVLPPALNACQGSGVIPVLVKEGKEVKVIPNGKSPNSESGLAVRDGGDKFNSVFSSSAWRLLEIALAETVGTGCLMFFGCMGLLGETLPPLQGAIVFGLVVCTIIQIFGHISAAHLNPVVTVAAIVLGKITPLTALVYFLAELVGAIVGFSLLKVVTPCDLWKVSSADGTGVCSTVPKESLTDAQSLALEFLATTFLILVVCSVWDSRNADKPDSVPLKFAVTITVISITVGPLTGASMNPVRTLAPALVNGVWTKHWIYWVAPMSAGFLGSVFYQLIFDRKQELKSDVAEEVPLTGVLASDCKSVHSLRQSNNALNDKPNNESQTQ